MVSKEEKLRCGGGGKQPVGTSAGEESPQGTVEIWDCLLPATVIPAALGMVAALERAGGLSAEKRARTPSPTVRLDNLACLTC